MYPDDLLLHICQAAQDIWMVTLDYCKLYLFGFVIHEHDHTVPKPDHLSLLPHHVEDGYRWPHLPRQ
jgi:hypothetical protein